MGLTADGVSGILGLAFPSEAAISSTIGRMLLDNIFSSLDPSRRYFAYKLNAPEEESTFSVGEIDSTYVNRSSDLQFSPVYATDGHDYDYWKLPLLSISLNSASVPFELSPSKVAGSSTPIAVLDTGTTLILGPSQDVDKFWKLIGGAQKDQDGTWKVRCNRAVSVGLTLGNDTVHREFILNPSDVNWMPTGSPSDDWCMGGVQGNDGVSRGLLCLLDFSSGPSYLNSVGFLRRLATWRHLFKS